MRLDSHEAIMIATAGMGGRIAFVNQAFARLTGYDAREWIGRSADLLSAEGALRMESLLWLDTAADGTESHGIARVHRGDGAPFCAEAHIHPVAARNGGIAHIALIMTDVTSRLTVKSRGTQISAPQATFAINQ
jgi:PAS domain S-box-containing protein